MDSPPVLSAVPATGRESPHPDVNSSNGSAEQIQDPAQAKASRHSKYFIEDALVIFKVENVLFRVHRRILTKNSTLFDTMFSCPPGPGGVEGETEERPIVLPDVKVEEFESLMRFFYECMDPSYVAQKMLPSSPRKKMAKTSFHTTVMAQMTNADLLNLLAISTRLLLDRVRQIAIATLDSRISTASDPIMKIELARKYNVEAWLEDAYFQVCKRPEPLTEEEGARLGLKTTILVARAREGCLLVNHTKKDESDLNFGLGYDTQRREIVKKTFSPRQTIAAMS